jgi:hypothetical protein
MMAHPADRAAAASEMFESAGDALEHVFNPTVPQRLHDGRAAESPDIDGLLAALMVAGGSCAVSNLQTPRAMGSEAFTIVHRKAAQIASAYAPPA